MWTFKLLWDSGSPIAYVGMLGCLIVIGARQHAIALMAHDGAHGTASANPWINDRLTELCAFWPFGIPIREYRDFHFRHHRNVGTERDPELVHKLSRWRFVRQWTLPLDTTKLILQVLGDFVGGALPHTAIALGVLMRPRTLYGWVMPRAYMAAWCVLFWYLGMLWVPVLWFVALSTTFWLVFRLRIWTEHVVESDAGDPTQRISATWLERFFVLPHNTFCHWEHHLTADALKIQIPCWNLPQARALVGGPDVLSIRELISRLRKAQS
jgi:fatty acid desaturase